MPQLLQPGPGKEDDAEAQRVKELLLEMQAAAFGHAAAYTSVIMFGGYASLFGIWSLTKDYMDRTTAYRVGLLLGVSVLTFVLFEIFGMLSRTAHLWRMRDLLTRERSAADFIAEHKRLSMNARSSIQMVTIPVWVIAFTISILSGLGAAGWLLLTFARHFLP